MKSTTQSIEKISVTGNANAIHRGRMDVGNSQIPCALGRSGISWVKTEGDGVTPAGVWRLRKVLYRADRIGPLHSLLPVHKIAPHDGWCDAPGDVHYNKMIKRPYPTRHERLWREDNLYDVVVILGFNDDPVIAGKGSAIFLHLAKPDYGPTEGCVAVSRSHMLDILGGCSARTVIDITVD